MKNYVFILLAGKKGFFILFISSLVHYKQLNVARVHYALYAFQAPIKMAYILLRQLMPVTDDLQLGRFCRTELVFYRHLITAQDSCRR